MKILKKDEICFEKGENGVLNCRFKDGTVHEHLHCVTLFPLTLPEQFISVVKEIDQEVEEIGVISRLDEFEEEQRQIIRHAVEERYFVPEILDVKKLKAKQTRGQSIAEWEIVTDRGKKILHLFNPRENISVNNSGVIIITDMEKNRYNISYMGKLPYDAKNIIEGMLL